VFVQNSNKILATANKKVAVKCKYFDVMTERVGFYQQRTKTVFPPCDKYFYLNRELFDILKCHHKEYFLWLRKSAVSMDYCSTSRTGLPLPIE
jgi:hypothetical protein